jgi:ATP-binding protein involved in chromosome partitioning
MIIATRDEIMSALQAVEDPEIHRSIVELNMVKDVSVEGSSVDITVALTIPDCPMKGRIKNDVVAAVDKLEGVDEVSVNLTTMSDEERQALVEKLSGGEESESPLLTGETGTQFVSVASGKGGVGKSTVTVNLAVALTDMGYTVGIIDADIYGSSIPQMLGVERPPTVVDNMVLPPEERGIRVISMSFFTQGNRPVIWRGPMLGKALQQFFDDVHWGELDYLLLDLPPGTGDVALDVHRLLPESKELIVTTPQETATQVAFRAGQMAYQTEHEIIGVIENMAYFESETGGEREYVFGKGGGKQLASQLGVPLLASIPLERAFQAGTAVFAADSKSAQEFKKIARAVEEALPVDRGE